MPRESSSTPTGGENEQSEDITDKKEVRIAWLLLVATIGVLVDALLGFIQVEPIGYDPILLKFFGVTLMIWTPGIAVMTILSAPFWLPFLRGETI